MITSPQEFDLIVRLNEIREKRLAELRARETRCALSMDDSAAMIGYNWQINQDKIRIREYKEKRLE